MGGSVGEYRGMGWVGWVQRRDRALGETEGESVLPWDTTSSSVGSEVIESQNISGWKRLSKVI